MKTTTLEKPPARSSAFLRLVLLAALFAIVFLSIFLIRRFPGKESEFVDGIAGQIKQEMEDNQIVLSSKGLRRTVADFQEPILLTHGKESRLIVHTAHLSETISIASEGLGGWSWTSAYKEIEYAGDAQYTVDLSQLTEADFMVNNELKVLTVRIPYAVLSPINIPEDKIKFHDVDRGWAAPKDINLTPEQYNQLLIQVKEKMKAKLVDEHIIDQANEDAKQVVAELLSATVQSIDPEFIVIVVQ